MSPVTQSRSHAFSADQCGMFGPNLGAGMESPRSDEEHSKPLPTGFPSCPGLVGSVSFARAWQKCGMASMSATATRGGNAVDYDHWVAEQAKVDARTEQEMASISDRILPLLPPLRGNCELCLTDDTPLLVLPCHGQTHAFCKECLLKTWGTVGPLRCPVCRQDVQ